MTNWNKSGIALVAATLLSANVWVAEGPAGHSHHSHGHAVSFSAGEPGNPKKPSRTVQVTMGDTPQGSTVYQSLFAVGLLLFAITFAMNLAATWTVRRFADR